MIKKDIKLNVKFLDDKLFFKWDNFSSKNLESNQIIKKLASTFIKDCKMIKISVKCSFSYW